MFVVYVQDRMKKQGSGRVSHHSVQKMLKLRLSYANHPGIQMAYIDVDLPNQMQDCRHLL